MSDSPEDRVAEAIGREMGDHPNTYTIYSLARAALAAAPASELASSGAAYKSSPGNLPVGEVEAVAKAILDSARQENPDIPIHWTFYEDEARAAIAALDASRQRDPQEAIKAFEETPGGS